MHLKVSSSENQDCVCVKFYALIQKNTWQNQAVNQKKNIHLRIRQKLSFFFAVFRCSTAYFCICRDQECCKNQSHGYRIKQTRSNCADFLLNVWVLRGGTKPLMPPDGSVQQGGKRKQPCYRRRCVTHRAADPLIALLFCFSLRFYCESKSTEIITSRPRTSQDEPETEKKPLRSDKTLTNYEADLLVIMRTNVSVSRKCRALRVHRSDTPWYSHIEKRPHVDSYHKICVICTGLGPLAVLLEESEQWCRLLQAIKTGWRKLPGQSRSPSGHSSRTKAAASEFESWLNLGASPSLMFSSSSLSFASGISPRQELEVWSQRRFVSVWKKEWKEKALAGCNSNSMWKAVCVPVEVLLPAERRPTRHLNSEVFWGRFTSIEGFLHMGHEVMTYELTASECNICLSVL